MSRSDGFLSRWSRRKLAPGDAPPADPETRAASAGEVAAAAPAEPDMLSPAELARLPSVDELTAETNLLPFLQDGVPAMLRNAALRRMWSIDPAVRDYPGDARDYAYDWNIPGGVPGAGPLDSADDVEGVISRMFASCEDLPLENADSTPERATLAAEPAQRKEAPASRGGTDVADEGETSAGPDPSEPVALSVAMAVPLLRAAGPTAPASKRRHGSAIPTLE